MKTYLSVIFCFCLVLSSQAQKVKYKEVFPLLYPQQTEEGIRLLRLFLQDEKNQYEANANIQMGAYYYQQYLSADVMLDTATMLAFGDSAIDFFERALPLVTEKELKRNDAYYQSYYRRDLRTGEFGIKLSDVKLDLENNVKSVTQRNQRVYQLHQLIQSMISTHKATVNAFNSLIDQYTSYEAFLFQLNPKQLEQLASLTEYQYSLTEKSEQFISDLNELGQANTLSQLELREVPTFKKVSEIFDPYTQQLVSWDMETWVDEVKGSFRSDVEVYKAGLFRWDQSLDLVKSRMESGLPSTITLTPNEQIRELQKKYDQQAAMMTFLEVKANRLLVKSLSDTVLHPQWLDSTRVQVNANLADSLMFRIAETKLKFEGLSEILKSEAANYEDHIDERYGGVAAMTASLSKWEKELDKLQTTWTDHQIYWNNKNVLIDWEGSVVNIDTTVRSDSAAYLAVIRQDIGDLTVALVKQNKDSSLHMISVGLDRTATWLTDLKQKYSLSASYRWLEAPSDQIAVLSFQTAESSGIAILSRLSADGSLMWAAVMKEVPSLHRISYDALIDQYTFYFFPEEQYPLTDGTQGYVIIDKGGKIK